MTPPIFPETMLPIMAADDPTSAPGARRAAALVFIFITVVLDVLALGNHRAGVLPGLVRDFLGGDTARGAEIYGAFGTVWAAMQFGFAPVLGALSDRFGRRPVILLSNFGLGLDYVLMALAPNLSLAVRRDGSFQASRRRVFPPPERTLPT